MSLGYLRRKIDLLNAEIVALFAKRLKVAKEIALVKKQQDLPVHDLDREQEQLLAIRKIAQDYELSPTVIEEIFTLFVDYSKLNMKMEMHRNE